MANVLFLVHRLPYPPNKGDKVRSFHLLKHLAAKHRVFLGTFVDDPDDQQYVETVKGYCADSHFASLNPRSAKIRSLNGLLAGEPLTLRYYRDAGLQDWVNHVCQTREIDSVVIFCSAMAQYVDHISRVPKLVDFVDVDSAKWSQYATSHKWPMSWLYRREGRLLLDYERQTAASASRSFFVTDAEVALFNRLAPECAVRVDAVCNGVDSDFFAPDDALTSPYAADEVPIVFTGAMDYHPNADAAQWFAKEVMPLVTAQMPKARFFVVGRSPGPEVLALQGEHVAVTGTVPDVRPYLQHAALVVAPLRIARGIQNKILEAMAMAKAVIASTECAGPIDATPGEELLAAASAESFASQIDALLRNPERAREIGRQGRAAVVARYSWDAHLSRIDRHLPQAPRSC
jgi:sugar transferase (PEP-CTERM/EpsH1 system associated)